MRRHGVAAVVAVLAATVLQTTAYAAPPPGACRNSDQGGFPVRELPWAQRLLDPRLVWPYSKGAGVLVAVVDSGVDVDHPQLRRPGKVAGGRDFVLPGAGPGAFDCVSHGTGVAGIIAADPTPGIGFHGVAPDSTILPVRISDRDVNDRGETLRIDPQVLANGIRYASDAGAKVINLSLAGYDDYAVVREAVAYAVSRDALVVAAAGNGQGQRSESVELPSYPAAYDGVLGVGAIDINGARMTGSQVGRYVDITAPGAQVLTPTRVEGHAYVDGTSFAAPFVSGTAALVRAAWPKLSAAEVAQRLIATASPARGGINSPAYGAGIVNPYRAVTDGLDLAKPAALPAYVPAAPDQARIDRVAWEGHVGGVAKWMALAVLGAVVLVVLVAVLRPRGRRRRWRLGWAATLPTEPVVAEPPEETFLV
ncbi:type VII secretion-associated serine protease mycosin [Actinocrispum wychmicini]|uniref:Type VII secretion-associated serine protease mycosin n=1 Tax=Actinocrispum wychmicini TaxID=1213861 RepID=A0A4R2JKT4_9PSEU|nr:type VII secretion-associated serine protease mycosin [Actinocrispum wychmicini]TCO54785.1 type VII secretion-associated serine protease mycosin [Actinocrispum wychmicini]